MEENDRFEPDYLKGFNEGYLIAQHTPELAEKLASIDSDFIRLQGFKAGREQYQVEQGRERLPAWLSGKRPAKSDNVPIRSKDRDQGLDKD